MTLLLIYFVYIVIWVVLVYLSYRIALKLSQSKKIAVAASLVAFLVMYWPAFGDLIPTFYTHKQLCKKEAGFKIFVTPEQWEKENPGVLETLVPYKKFTVINHVEFLNQRIGVESESHRINNLALRKQVTKLVDVETKKVVAQFTDFSSGYWFIKPRDWRVIKLWLDSYTCFSNKEIKKVNVVQKEFYEKMKIEWRTY